MAHDVLNGFTLPVNAGSAGAPSNVNATYEGDMAMIITHLRALRSIISSAGAITATGAISGTTLSLTGKIALAPLTGAASASGLLMGTGTTAQPALTAVAGANFVEMRCKTTATSGDNRLAYLRYDMMGIGANGECIRANTPVGVAVATARGQQISLSLKASGSVTGLGVGGDHQLLLATACAPTGGTYFAGQSEVYMEGADSSLAGATTHAIHSFIANGDSTGVATVLNAMAFKGSVGGGKMIKDANSTGGTESNGCIRILVDEGSGYAVRYLRYWDNPNS